MRVHISLSDEIVGELDRRVGVRRRSSFIAQAVRQALDEERRWELIESSVGSIANEGHEWDQDPAEWVRLQRHGDDRRLG